MPGVFHAADTTTEYASLDLLAAGKPGQPPGFADGQARAAQFTAPRDLQAVMPPGCCT